MPTTVELFPGVVYKRTDGIICMVAHQEPDAPQDKDTAYWFVHALNLPPHEAGNLNLLRGTDIPENIHEVYPIPLPREMVEYLISPSLPPHLREAILADFDEGIARGTRRISAPNLLTK